MQLTRKINLALTLKYEHKAKVMRHREHQHKGEDQDKQNRLTLEETGHSETRNMLYKILIRSSMRFGRILHP